MTERSERPPGGRVTWETAMPQQESIDDGFQAWAGVGGVALVLTLGLAALWAGGAAETTTAATAVPAQVETEAAGASPAVALYGDEGGAHDKPTTPATETSTPTSLFDTR